MNKFLSDKEHVILTAQEYKRLKTIESTFEETSSVFKERVYSDEYTLEVITGSALEEWKEKQINSLKQQVKDTERLEARSAQRFEAVYSYLDLLRYSYKARKKFMKFLSKDWSVSDLRSLLQKSGINLPY